MASCRHVHIIPLDIKMRHKGLAALSFDGLSVNLAALLDPRTPHRQAWEGL
jgi:hypothetical protein